MRASREERRRPRRSGPRRFLLRGALLCTGAPLGAFLLLLLLAPGCDARCVRHSDCPLDYACREDGLCALPLAPPAGDGEADAGTGPIGDLPDASLDGGEPDAGEDDDGPVVD
jgi:hypothetical protein